MKRMNKLIVTFNVIILGFTYTLLAVSEIQLSKIESAIRVSPSSFGRPGNLRSGSSR